MLLYTDKQLSEGKLGKNVFVFMFNYMIQMALFMLVTFFRYRDNFSVYIAENLPLFFFAFIGVFILYWVIYQYYVFENKLFLSNTKNAWMLFLTLDIAFSITYSCGFIDVYARPVALFALLALFLINYHDALFLNAIYSIMVFLCDLFINYSTVQTAGIEGIFSPFLVCFIGGTFAVFFVRSVNSRFGLVIAGVVSAIPDIVIALLFAIAADGDIFNTNFVNYIGYGFLGGGLTVAFLMALLPIFERMFNVLTVFRLQELMSSTAPLLRQLQQDAPGTFNHSLVVAEIVAACAADIGENVELARAAAYYHDVGKLRQPEFFSENQSDYNLHDELTPELSADIIRSHTKDGYDLIKSEHLPEFFAEIARQHHGTMPITYFYTKALRMSDGDIKIENYSYLGPKPQTKIAAIVMIADSSEAATRAVGKDPEKAEKCVRTIIQERMDLGQFTDCPITLEELEKIKNTIVSTLTGVYHHRVKYPNVKFSRTGVEDRGGTKHDR